MEGSATSQPGLKRNWKSVEIRLAQGRPQNRQISWEKHLIGGLEHFFIFPYIENNHPN